MKSWTQSARVPIYRHPSSHGDRQIGLGYKPVLGCSKNRGESESTARFCGVGLDLDLDLDERPALVLDEPSTLEGATKGDLVGILEIATNREPGGEPRDPQVQVHQHA